MGPSDNIPDAHKQTLGVPTNAEDLEDVVLVNPGGRVVAVTGEDAERLLQERGYRVATKEEAAPLDDAAKAAHPEVLRQREAQRVAAEQKAASDYLAQAGHAVPAAKEAPKASKPAAKAETTSNPQPAADATPASSEPATDAPAASDSSDDTPKSRSSK